MLAQPGRTDLEDHTTRTADHGVLIADSEGHMSVEGSLAGIPTPLPARPLRRRQLPARCSITCSTQLDGLRAARSTGEARP